MIASLRGKITHYDERSVVLEVAGVGYLVHTTADIFTKLTPGESENVFLWTYQAVRENALDLYGFLSRAELTFFELLISVSGIGPKTALGILNIASVNSLQNAISTGDTSHLVKVSGLGKKTAEKIVLELRDKIDHLSFVDSEGNAQTSNDSDAIEALKALGYPHNEARDALKTIDKSITDTGAKVKAALKMLK